MNNAQIAKGDRVRDTITGYEGLVVCVADWINGCVRFGIQAEKLDKDGKPYPLEFFDAQQVELIEAGIYPEEREVIVKDDTGGPRDDPS